MERELDAQRKAREKRLFTEFLGYELKERLSSICHTIPLLNASPDPMRKEDPVTESPISLLFCSLAISLRPKTDKHTP